MRLNGNNLRAAGPYLYDAARCALSLLVDDARIPDNEKKSVIKSLKNAVELAEGGQDAHRFKFVTTHTTAAHIMSAIKSVKAPPDLVKALRRSLTRGRRDTKQRVYFSLEIDLPVIKLLHFILKDHYAGSSTRAFDRIAAQIEKEVLSKSPLQLLAEAGL